MLRWAKARFEVSSLSCEGRSWTRRGDKRRMDGCCGWKERRVCGNVSYNWDASELMGFVVGILNKTYGLKK